MKRLYKVLLSLALICIFTAIIFSFSEQNGDQSHSLSQQVSYKIASTILQGKDSSLVKEGSIMSVANALDHPVRKFAHITIYAGLGCVLISCLWFIFDYELHFAHILVTLAVIFSIGCSDEIVQYFSGGRGAAFSDVLIDTFGGAIGAYLHFIIRDFFQHLNHGIKKIKKYKSR